MLSHYRHPLLPQAAEEIISMDNGCACCTVRGDLVKAFEKLRDRKDEFDLILLETTGALFFDQFCSYPSQ